MGSAIKKAANATLGFFREVGNVIGNSTKKVIEVIVNGTKKVVNFFKKVITYCWNGIKIAGKLFYCAGKQIIHTLTGKKGIPYLIDFFNEIKKKNVSIKDENDNEINPNDYLRGIAEKMQEGDTIKLKSELMRKETKSEEDSFRDFETKDDDPSEILGLNIGDSIAKVGEKEMRFENFSYDRH